MTALRYVRRSVLALVGLAVVIGLWELYKVLGPPRGGSLFGVPLLARASDAAMPHLTSVLAAFSAQEVGGATIVRGAAAPTVFESVLSAGGNSLLWAGVGFVLGVVIGMALALVMDAVQVLERALLPWIVLSQTVPLIALAPLVTGWGQGLSLGPLEWQRWMSVSLIAGYLAFFPVAVGMARGLKSPGAVPSDYFRSVDAGWWQTLTRLKLPASVPYLVPALRLAAAGAVVGTVVGEISIGLEGGIGRLVVSYSQGATGDPSRVYAAVVGAAALGLVAAAVVTLFDLALRRYQRTDSA
jgi:NitT/TauT family transport system permease protein